MTQTTLPIDSKVNIKSDTPILVEICDTQKNLADGTWEWTIKAIEEHEGVRSYRLETRTLGRHFSYNQVMNGPCPQAHDYVTHTHWVAVDPSERD